ncbi:hypothetical protein DRW03_21350 [Corallococcus sp. H22C18031201]|nr:hypothetical protein DRW03_21350 [Corallococcus sp. H22C18031201]
MHATTTHQDAPRPALRLMRTPTYEIESLVAQLQELPEGCAAARLAESRLAQLLLPVLARIAGSIAREWGARHEDLVQEAMAETLRLWRKYPRREGAGYAAYVSTLARQRMLTAATVERSAVHVTRHARRKLGRAKRAAREQDIPLSEAMAAQGLNPDTQLALGDGTVHAAMPVDALLGLADASGETRGALALMERAMAELHRLPRLERAALSALMGVGEPGGRPASVATLAERWSVPHARIRTLQAEALERLRKRLARKGGG